MKTTARNSGISVNLKMETSTWPNMPWDSLKMKEKAFFITYIGCPFLNVETNYQVEKKYEDFRGKEIIAHS